MADRLLDRQLRLLDYLTSGAAIFGVGDDAGSSGGLDGLDPHLLKLEARFSHEKRMEKIAAVFPHTFRLLGIALEAIIRRFVGEAPPVDISRLANARQFYAVLSAIWRRRPPQPPYLPDVAALELACAEVRHTQASGERCEEHGLFPGVRRHRNAILLRCQYDIRAIFEDDVDGEAPARRDTWLAVTPAGDGNPPSVCEIDPALFDLLEALDDWTDLSVLHSLPAPMVGDLIRRAFIEVRR